MSNQESTERPNDNTQSRRRFLKVALSATTGVLAACSESRGLNTLTVPSAARVSAPRSVMSLAAHKLDRVRLGIIGVGRRGSGHLKSLRQIDGVDIIGICDVDQRSIKDAQKIMGQTDAVQPHYYSDGEFAYRDMLARDDIDAVLIATPWRYHTPMAVDTMNAQKHAFVEVPAALNIDECWQLVETSEKTQMICMMMENVCYGREEMMVLNMVQHGVFGELTHGEAAYIHDLRTKMHDIDRGPGTWRELWQTRRNANLYPTHGLGPIAWYMDINRGDQFDYLTSMGSLATGRKLYAQREFSSDHARNKLQRIAGDINSSLIKTKKGRTILVQYDVTTPRPYSRLNFIQGTNGAFGGFPNRIALESEGDFHVWDQDMSKWYEKFEHPLWKKMYQETNRKRSSQPKTGHRNLDFMMLWRMVYCLRNSLPFDQNVYDAAAWSAVTNLSQVSVSNRSSSVDFPDFTRGLWKSASPLEIKL